MSGSSPTQQDAAQPFTMLGGDGIVCEGDVCNIPAADSETVTS
ncbi:MAG: hypothetical protein ABGX78_05940 [Microbacterium sp.]|jgi:hypothetical protein|nr:MULTISPECIES: hypothetical protein [unclassified Microbacterium]|tara:strand:- start:2455 stop:2583 length:129 start_codon:yes stop_codon:yes gene_type:complete